MIAYDLTGTEGRPSLGNYIRLVDDLLGAPVVATGEWQAMNTAKSKLHATHEIEDVTIVIDPLPSDLDQVVPFIDLPWADDHFLERVSGIPHNPAPSHLSWPYAVRGNGDHTDQGDRFDHTYPERFWPQHAGHPHNYVDQNGRVHLIKDSPALGILCRGTTGIRFSYGDLSDVVAQLVRSPLTRQAFLPVWFPEDTGAKYAQRVPCTLGYHFMARNGRLSCRYYIRSCDIYRHFSNDVYLAAMLTRWIVTEVNHQTSEIGFPPTYMEQPLRTGRLLMYISSLHALVGDTKKINERLEKL